MFKSSLPLSIRVSNLSFVGYNTKKLPFIFLTITSPSLTTILDKGRKGELLTGFGLRLLRRKGLPEAVLVALQEELHLLLLCFSFAIPGNQIQPIIWSVFNLVVSNFNANFVVIISVASWNYYTFSRFDKSAYWWGCLGNSSSFLFALGYFFGSRVFKS